MERINDKLVNIINESATRDSENRNFVPFSHAQRTLLSVVKHKHRNSDYQENAMMKYSPLADWLAKPKTIDEFIELKNDMFELTRDAVTLGLDRRWRWNVASEQNAWMGRKIDWDKTLDWVFSLSNAFRIWPKENLAYFREIAKSNDYQLWSGDYAQLEGTYLSENEISLFDRTPYSLEELSETLREKRGKHHILDDRQSRPIIERLGLIIADLRVGDHSAHGKFFYNAKNALGARGALVVVTPSKRTILETTDKGNSWDDDDRIYRLRSNRLIDLSLLVDMPEKYYSNPTEYWKIVWKTIKPDFVFLGEENHPLEPLYREQSKSFGGILLIDDRPITKRSSDLLEVK